MSITLNSLNARFRFQWIWIAFCFTISKMYGMYIINFLWLKHPSGPLCLVMAAYYTYYYMQTFIHNLSELEYKFHNFVADLINVLKDMLVRDKLYIDSLSITNILWETSNIFWSLVTIRPSLSLFLSETVKIKN